MNSAVVPTVDVGVDAGCASMEFTKSSSSFCMFGDDGGGKDLVSVVLVGGSCARVSAFSFDSDDSSSGTAKKRDGIANRCLCPSRTFATFEIADSFTAMIPLLLLLGTENAATW